MKIELTDIEKAIRANFVLRKDSTKILETDREKEKNSYGAGRMVFVGIALRLGYKRPEICEHLKMTITEYNGKAKSYRQLYEAGLKKTQEKPKKRYEQGEFVDLDLRIYRKTVLVKNYLTSLQREAAILF